MPIYFQNLGNTYLYKPYERTQLLIIRQLHTLRANNL